MQAAHSTLKANPTQLHRFHLLDGLRGLVAVIVVLHHIPLILRPWLPAPDAWLAVDFFFVLSGFVIAYSYEHRIQTSLRLQAFAVARLIRLFPLYLMGLVLGTLSTLLVAHFGAQLRVSTSAVLKVGGLGLLLIPNIFLPWPFLFYFPLNPPAWSLFFELVSNLTYALILHLGRISQCLTVAIVAAALLVLVYAPGDSLDLGPYRGSFLFGLARVGFSFFCGNILFGVYKKVGPTMTHGSWTGKHLYVLPLIAVVGVLLFGGELAFARIYQLACVAIVFPLSVLLGALSTIPHRAQKVCIVFGDFSYPLYILHFPIAQLFQGRKMERLASTHHAGMLIASTTVLLLMPVVAWKIGHFDLAVRRRLTAAYNGHIVLKALNISS